MAVRTDEDRGTYTGCPYSFFRLRECSRRTPGYGRASCTATAQLERVLEYLPRGFRSSGLMALRSGSTWHRIMRAGHRTLLLYSTAGSRGDTSPAWIYRASDFTRRERGSRPSLVASEFASPGHLRTSKLALPCLAGKQGSPHVARFVERPAVGLLDLMIRLGLESAADEGLAAGLAQLVDGRPAFAGPGENTDAAKAAERRMPNQLHMPSSTHGYVRAQALVRDAHDELLVRRPDSG